MVSTSTEVERRWLFGESGGSWMCPCGCNSMIKPGDRVSKQHGGAWILARCMPDEREARRNYLAAHPPLFGWPPAQPRLQKAGNPARSGLARQRQSTPSTSGWAHDGLRPLYGEPVAASSPLQGSSPGMAAKTVSGSSRIRRFLTRSAMLRAFVDAAACKVRTSKWLAGLEHLPRAPRGSH